MKNIIILDTETTGLEENKGAKVIEIAVILFNVPTKTVLQELSTLLPVTDNPQYKVNKIKPEASNEPMAWEEVKKTINATSKFADAVVAHNAEFDKKWMASIDLPDIAAMPWICSCHDFTWPWVGPGSKSLISIALSMGIPVFAAHRALADCRLLAECFAKVKDLEERLEKAKIGKALYKALVSFDERQLAKDAGFAWNQLVPNAWAAKLSEEEAAEIKDFKIMRID